MSLQQGFLAVLFWLLILQASVFATTIYLHRGKTHGALEFHPVVGFLFHLYLTVFTGVVPREWVAVHRKHHHFSDEEGDPHSPLIFGKWKVLFGNYFYYKSAINQANIRKYTPEWKNDLLDGIPGMGFGVLLGLVVFCLLFGWWGILAWGSNLIVFILLNSAINSLGHTVGYRNFDQQATNLQWLALLTGGEGLHNNHHEHPTSARFSLRQGELDPAWPFIRLLTSLGLAKLNLPALEKAGIV